jgi:phosphoribosylamine---glycine ligase
MAMANKINPDDIKSVLIADSWSKGQITVKNIKNRKELSVYVYMDQPNPGIIELADGYKIGDFEDIRAIADYAREIKADIVIPTAAYPLEAGLADLLVERNIPVFGPLKTATRLESDKGFARRVVSECNENYVPRFMIFEEEKPALEYAESLGWKVAVKPVGLTGGLGVKVFGDQLWNKKDITSCIREVLEKDAQVLIEEKLTGEEFSLQCLVNDTFIVPTPPVQDFKKLLAGDQGPNTGSMGSYSDHDHLLPFLTEKDHQDALTILEGSIRKFIEITGRNCCGFLYGQFMKTQQGIKLIEFNFRPGDPEWMNTLSILQGNLLDVIIKVLNKEEVKPEFMNLATVCKYITPEKYPEKLHEILDASLDKSKLDELGVDFYYSASTDRRGRLNVGEERGIAFIATDATVPGACKKVEEAIATVKGSFRHRKDIGSEKMVRAQKMKMDVVIRHPEESEFIRVRDVIAECQPLIAHPIHFYKIILRYFNRTALVAELDGQLIGFTFCLESQNFPGRYFLWQIGVIPSCRYLGVGPMLVRTMEEEIGLRDGKEIEVTVEPDNPASLKLFEQLGYRNVSKEEGETLVIEEKDVVKDYYGPGRHHILLKKDLARRH